MRLKILSLIVVFVSQLSQPKTVCGQEFALNITPTIIDYKNTDPLPSPVSKRLETLMTKLLATINIGGGYSSRFIIFPRIDILDSEVLGTAPPKYVYDLEITFVIADGISGNTYATVSENVKGLGKNESEGYMTAVRKLNVNDEMYNNFVSEAEVRITEYYQGQCSSILSEANMLSSTLRFDEAIFMLNEIPRFVDGCFDKAVSAMSDIFQVKIDRECKEFLTMARSVWNASPDGIGATDASIYLANVEPYSSCYPDALALSEEISARVRELDQREWEFQLKQQNDAVELEKQAIKAARDVGVAYGENQPDININDTFIVD